MNKKAKKMKKCFINSDDNFVQLLTRASLYLIQGFLKSFSSRVKPLLSHCYDWLQLCFESTYQERYGN